ncbi:MAG TPA: cytochrome-c peroxidase [Chloroflexota bacterium]|nr:cytochrome-c peroxidase [Chloroflexota bacterium]
MHKWLLVCLLIAEAGCTSPIESTRPVPTGVAAGQVLAHEPISPIPVAVDLDAAKVALGSSLFEDPRLSHDNSVACSTCHHLDTGGVDRLRFSIGIYGQIGGRNAPTVFNSGFNFRQFWDGRAATLEDQIDGPTANPLEMGSNWPEITRKLNASADYSTTFARLYGGPATALSVKDAVATFERSLSTPNSRFDKFLRGDTTALTAVEVEGYDNFKSFGCVSCHQGTNVGGNMYQRLGVVEAPPPTSQLMDDIGRFGVTGDVLDRHVYKVPSLRNVAVTAPYFHDGSVSTLEGAVTLMGRYQLGRQLTSAEIERLVAFLKTLTGEYAGTVLK